MYMDVSLFRGHLQTTDFSPFFCSPFKVMAPLHQLKFPPRLLPLSWSNRWPVELPTHLFSAWMDSLFGPLGLGTWANLGMETLTDRLYRRSAF